MARNKGTFQFAANFEVKAAEALDPRIVVATKSELINKETWPSDGDTLYLYEGLLVSVADEGKIYMLTNVSNALSADYSAWKEIGAAETIDIVNNLESDRIDAALSAAQGKSLKAAIDEITIPEYNVVKLETATEGYSASYQFQKNGNGVGAIIDIPKDLVVSSGSVKEVSVEGEPYENAAIGDLYVELVLANSVADSIYIPVNKLVDKYVGDDYITVSGNNLAFNYDVVVAKIKEDISLSSIAFSIESLTSSVNTLETSVATNTANIATLTANLETKASKSEVEAVKTLINDINEVNAGQATSISNLEATVETFKVKDIDTTASSGISLTLTEGVVGIVANLSTADIKISNAIGSDVVGTSLQTTLTNLNNKITSAISGGLTSITTGNGLEVSEVVDNSQKINLKIKENAGIAVDEEGLHLVWTNIE